MPSPSSSRLANSTNSVERRQLVRPSTHIPWSVDVVGALPKRLLEHVRNDEIKAGASCPGWACLALGNGCLYVWQRRAIPLSDPLEPPQQCLKLFMPDLILDGENQQILLGLSGDLDAVNLYALHKNWLILRKLTTNDLKTKLPMRSHTTKTRVDLQLEDQQQQQQLQHQPQDSNRWTSLTVAPNDKSNLVILGTSSGSMYWVTHTAVPMGLHVQKVAPPAGLWNRFFGSTDAAEESSTKHILPQSSGTEFLSFSTQGSSLIQWKVSLTVASAHHATFEPISKGRLMLENHNVAQPEIILATLAADQQSLHCILRGTSASNNSQEPKLYWVQAGLDGTVQKCHWLSRFADPTLVKVIGLTAAENGNAYAAFEHHNVILVVVLLQEEDVLQEVDLPSTQVPALLPNLLERDAVTHGCSLMATSGIGLRVRYLPNDPIRPSAKKARFSSSRSNQNTPNNLSTIHTLVSHLRSIFWQSYQDPQMHRPMPPSLKQAAAAAGGGDSSSDCLEQAIVAFGAELQHKGDASSSAQNPMEWHKAFVKLLQQGGLYRSVSQSGRWQLLSIGQELAVFGHLCRRKLACPAYDIADWLLEQQQDSVLSEMNTSADDWNALLATTLDAAMEFREEFINPFYDVVTDHPTEPIWSSHPSLQKVLEQQLQAWTQNLNKGAVELTHIESVVKAALRSFSESYDSNKKYADIKVMAIGLLRSVNRGDDELAFDLCIQFQYLEGLCRIAVDHEKQRDANNYSLDPLFATMQGAADLTSGFSFAQFILQWHTDAGLYGHAINYGRHSPTDLSLIMKQDERLRKYQWIPAIRQGNFDDATESCLALDDKTLGSNHWALSLAKLSNKLCFIQNPKRQQIVERQLELVSAQHMLEPAAPGSTLLGTPEELVHLALRKLQTATNNEDQVRLSTIALAVCAAMEDPKSSVDHAAHVWAESLRLDADDFSKWLKTETDLTNPHLREKVLADTVFGILLQECRKDDAMTSVTYGRHIESAVIEKIGGDAIQMEFSRLLRSVTAQADSIQARSLVVASY